VSCPTPAQLAAAASGEELAVIEHTRECLTCRALLIEQRELIAAARRLPRPALRPERRAQLAAEVMAATDFHAPRWRGERVMVITASVVAAAAIITLVLAARGPGGQPPSAPELASLDEPATKSARRAHEGPVAAPQRAAIIGKGAVFARAQRGDEDVVTLRDGEVSIDATDREPVTVVAGDTRVMIVASRAKVIARQGVIVTTHVFAGNAQVTTNGRSQVIDAGDVWMRPEPKPVAPPASGALTESTTAFRQGWEELRAKRHAEAIAAFDRATDPVVAEDAAFWAAIATERAGDLDGAATRLRAFLDRFPQSPRAETARAALVRVTR
jgi:TolA-binding protein